MVTCRPTLGRIQTLQPFPDGLSAARHAVEDQQRFPRLLYHQPAPFAALLYHLKFIPESVCPTILLPPFDGVKVEAGVWFIGAMTFPHLDGRAEMLARELDLSAQAAEWVALAALHSGCFLRSQYCAYSGHSREAARLLVGSLMERRIAEDRPFEEHGLLCRLTSKAVYRALGVAEIRHHRRASRPVLYRLPTRFVQKYTLRLAHLELGGVDFDLAVEDDVLPLDRADMTQQVGVEREVRSGGNP